MLMAKTWEETEKSFRQENNVMECSEFSFKCKQTHPQSTFRLDVHYCQYGLVQDCVSYIFTCLCVRCNLQAFTRQNNKNPWTVKWKQDWNVILTCARMSFIASLESSSLLPKIRSSLNIRT